MAKTRKQTARREQIIKAAEKIFADKGFHETTISEIAKAAGLSEPTIYEYFASKEDILFTIPEETSCKLGELIDFHLKMAKGTAAKLRAMIYIIFWIHQTNPSYAAVSYLILRQSSRYTKSASYAVLRKRLRPLINVIEEGIAAGEIRSGFTPYFIRSVILGTIEHLTTRKLLLTTQESLLEYVDPLVNLIMGGIQPTSEHASRRFTVTIEPESGAASITGSTDAGTAPKMGKAGKKA